MLYSWKTYKLKTNMNCYYDAEFIEGTQKIRIGRLALPKIFNTNPTIDLISIGIVRDDGAEYYEISKEFNLNEAWYRWDGEFHEQNSYEKYHQLPKRKKYWIRENVLKPIFIDLGVREINEGTEPNKEVKFSLKQMKRLISKYGKLRKDIAIEIQEFIYGFAVKGYPKENTEKIASEHINLYGYYSAYDHVTFCWLFGKMKDLPKCFPMFTIDLKQKIDGLAAKLSDKVCYESGNHTIWDINKSLSVIKADPSYPINKKEHTAIDDARWNKELNDFINNFNKDLGGLKKPF